jgi:hypothetical protein
MAVRHVELRLGTFQSREVAYLQDSIKLALEDLQRNVKQQLAPIVEATSSGGGSLAAGVLAQATKPSTQTGNAYYGGGSGNNVLYITGLDLTFTPTLGKTQQLNWHVITGYSSNTVYTRSILYRIDGGTWISLGSQAAVHAEIHSGNCLITGLSPSPHLIEFGVNTDLNNAGFGIFSNATDRGYVFDSYTYILEFA